MIPVEPAPEPAQFNDAVRQPGLRAIAELVGESATPRTGRKRKVVAERREDLKPEEFPPYWRELTDELLTAYDRVCAYACLYIERITGSATFDHWIPVSQRWDKVYEWTNYRLACSIMNSRKRDYGDVIDPFEVSNGMFALDLVSLKAIPGPSAGDRRSHVQDTIERLGLDSADHAAALEEYYHGYLDGDIKLSWLEKRAPFLAREMRRQGKLLPCDV